MKSYKRHFKTVLTDFVKAYRKGRHYTQEEMAARLGIDVRSYSDLDNGVHCFSAATLIMFLLMLSEEELHKLLDLLRAAKLRAQREASEDQPTGV